MKKCLLLLVLFFTFAMGYAQNGRQLRPLYRLDGGDFQNKGWFFGPGMTYTIPAQADNPVLRARLVNENLDTLFVGDFDPSGAIGAYLEVGRFHFFKNPIFIHYIDYGIHYKMLRASESFSGQMLVTDSTSIPITENLASVEIDSYFNRHQFGAFFNAYHITQITDRSFIQLGLGANLDYALFKKIETPEPRTYFLEKNAEDFGAQLHAKLGFGFKAESGVFIVPSIETPILSLFPFDDGKSTLPMFSSRYRPIIFSIRFMFFSRTKAADCVGSNPNPKDPGLWGQDMKRKSGKKKKRRKK